MFNPGGNDPPAIVHVYGGVPPAAMRFWVYVLPTVPTGSGDGVVIVSSASTANVNCLWAVSRGWPLSATPTVKVGELTVVGVPLITPAAFNVSPAGGALGGLDTIVQVYGPVPPLAIKVKL